MNDDVLLIFGTTNTGMKFRPSDWIERFCGVMAPYSTKYQSSSNDANFRNGMGYSDLVFPATYQGERVVIAFKYLNDIEPLAWEFVLTFAKENDLKTQEASQSHFLSKNPIQD